MTPSVSSIHRHSYLRRRPPILIGRVKGERRGGARRHGDAVATNGAHQGRNDIVNGIRNAPTQGDRCSCAYRAWAGGKARNGRGRPGGHVGRGDDGAKLDHFEIGSGQRLAWALAPKASVSGLPCLDRINWMDKHHDIEKQTIVYPNEQERFCCQKEED